MDDAGGAPPGTESGPGDIDRLEALEQQVRQLTSRLAGWVEAQLVQALDDRRNDMKALRAEMQVVLNEHLAGMRAESSSVLSVATRRLEVGQEQLAERLDTVAERAADASAKAIALAGSSSVGAERLDLLEQQVSHRLAELQQQMKADLDAVTERQQADGEIVRAEVTSGLAVLSSLPSAAQVMEQRVEARLADVDRVLRSELDALRTESQVLAGEIEAGPVRLDAFERRVKAAMGRLTESVETRLAETATTRASDIDALRSELTDRIDGVERALGRAAEGLPALQLSVLAGAERTETLEREMKAVLARVTDLLDARMAELVASHEVGLDGLRAELAATVTAAAAMSEQLDTLGTKAAAVADDVTGFRADVEAGRARTDALEKRVKAAVGRLAESVEVRLGESAAARAAEVDVATAALRARVAQVQERVDAVEHAHQSAGERVGELMEAKLAEVADRRQGELEAMKAELQEALAVQLREARREIGVAVADAHRRFVVSVDTLEERMHLVSEQATAAWTAVAGIETLQETVGSDGRRIEALETHTRRTDARLGDVVDAKLAERAGAEGAGLEQVREELRAAVDKVQEQVTTALGALPGEVSASAEGLQGQMRAALDAHLAETRAEVTLALGEARAELAAGAEQVEALQLALDQQSAKAMARLDALGASVEASIQGAEERLDRTVGARLAEVEAAAADVAETRAALGATVASLSRKVARVQDQVQKKSAAVSDQMAALVKSAAAEAGSLAPLRSDLRLLQAQVADLAEVVEHPRPKRKAPVKKAAPAAARKAAPAPARKAAARRATPQ
ncbi:MAG: hypothetical protein ACR2KK_09815 [Acidimicrobiales bacterium]